MSRWLSPASAPLIIAPALQLALLPPSLPFFSIHTLIIPTEMLFAVTAAEFTTPSTAFAYCLIWTFSIETVPQLLMVCLAVIPPPPSASPSPTPSPPSPQQCPDKSDEVNS